MDRRTAAALTARSRSYGWFRPNLSASSGYRTCPICRTRISGTGHGSDDVLARTVNDAIDEAMTVHLLEDGCGGA